MENNKLSWYAFICSSSQNPDFQVAAIDGHEALGTTYRFMLDLVSSNFNLDLSELITKTATLEMDPWGAGTSIFNGVITQAQSLRDVAGGKMLYRVVLEPKLAQLRYTILNKAYINDSTGLDTIDIIKQVLERNNLVDGKDFDLSKISATPRKRSLFMQYQESDLDFVTRWLEFEGMYYYFVQDYDKKTEKLFFIDNNSSFATDSIGLKYRPYGSIAMDQYKSSLTHFNEISNIVVKDVSLKNYDFRKSQDMVSANASNSSISWGQRMWFGDDLRANDEASHYASIRAEALNISHQLVEGICFATGLFPGSQISIEDHPRKNLNDKFRVISIHHQGSQAGFGIQKNEQDSSGEENFYTAKFTAIPEATPFRLQIQTPRPYISGYLPALVKSNITGAADLDEWGRYKVGLVFEEKGEVSIRVRMATPYNSPSDEGQTGLHFPLLPDSEVMLCFMDGNPDQPVIAGALNTSLSLSPVNHNNPTKNRLFSKLGNEIHMDDDDKTQGVRMRSSKGAGMMFIGSFGGDFEKNTS
jgi:type VI secretion system secreted protein VgrG